MPTMQEMTTSLEDARFFNDEIEKIVRGPQSGHDLAVIRRYFRGYLHCWKTVLHLIRDAKGLSKDKDWIKWCQRWQTKHLDGNGIESMDQLRETRDYDTHTGTIVVSGEGATTQQTGPCVDRERERQEPHGPAAETKIRCGLLEWSQRRSGALSPCRVPMVPRETTAAPCSGAGRGDGTRICMALQTAGECARLLQG
jgi:hypothetical protein